MLINVPLDQIDDNPFQRRRDYGDVAGLAADIESNGLLQTPAGRLIDEKGDRITKWNTDGIEAGLIGLGTWRVQLAFGHRRLRAYRLLAGEVNVNLTMPVEIAAFSDDRMLDAVWSENQHRSDINAIEQAELLAEKLARARAEGGSQRTVADAWGIDRSTVANKIRLLDLPAEVQQALRERRLSERQALALLPVIELESKVNGTPVRWGDPDTPWVTQAPAAYIARVIADPNTETSDRIRDYTRRAAERAGNPIGHDFAKFEAGEGPDIVQSACKGCLRRFDQTCLSPACYEARRGRYFAAIEAEAAAKTGLPFSSEASHFSLAPDERRSVQADWEAGNHDHLVVGISTGYVYWRPYTDDLFITPAALLEDWKAGVVIGRRGPSVTAGDTAGEPVAARPTEAELKGWKALVERGNRERTKRVQAAFHLALEPVSTDETAMRVLLTMLNGSWMSQANEDRRSPSSHEFAGQLLEKAWKSARTWHNGASNRDVMCGLLATAGFSPDIADPPEPALRLADIGRAAVVDYEAQRDWVDEEFQHKRLRLVRDALAEFDTQPAVVSGNGELELIAGYLRAAITREEALVERKEGQA